MKGAAAMAEFEPDWIVAIGGGSPIDAAKAMWIKYEYPDITFEDMCKVFGIPKLRKKAHFCAISSTSVRQLRLLRSQSSQIMRRVSSIQSQTLRLHRCCNRRPRACRDNATEACCTHRNGCHDTCYRGICINSQQ